MDESSSYRWLSSQRTVCSNPEPTLRLHPAAWIRDVSLLRFGARGEGSLHN